MKPRTFGDGGPDGFEPSAKHCPKCGERLAEKPIEPRLGTKSDTLYKCRECGWTGDDPEAEDQST